MDWRFVARMGALGLVVGVLNLFGWLPARMELPVWLAVGTIWVVTAARTQRKAPFQHVFMAGVVAGFLSADVPAVFFGTFLQNNPDLVTNATQDMAANATDPTTPGGGITRIGLILAGTVWGVLFGMLAGATALLAVRITEPAKPKQEREEARLAPPFGAHMDMTHPGRDERGEAEREDAERRSGTAHGQDDGEGAGDSDDSEE